ncbi:hypothetical protein BGZ57DRAFT_931287 [Hyaloscypha finlandica]|nr:hypothetical protein BGZ57DRAFT_931287 [Hyaloscypha finlandica]
MADAPNKGTSSSPYVNFPPVQLTFAILGSKLFSAGVDYVAKKASTNASRLIPSTCRRLSWEDLPEGPLHICRASTYYGTHDGCDTFHRYHKAGDECWESTLANIFNRSWSEFEVLSERPKGLMLTEYLETDLKTLMSYIACGVDTFSMHVFSSSAWYTPPKYEARNLDKDNRSFQLRAKDIQIDFKRMPKVAEQEKGHLVAHVTGSFHHYIDGRYDFSDTDAQALKPISLSKADMQCILEGYPPYYRSEYILRGTSTFLPGTTQITLQNPIPTFSDRTRGGWVIAVGRTYVTPVAFYVDEEGHHPGGRFPAHIGASMTRVRDVLEKDIAPEFPKGDPWYDDVCAAVAAVNHLLWEKSASDLYRFWPKEGGHHGSIDSLDEGASNAVIALFNRFGPLTAAEKSLVKDYTLAILEVAIRGASTVTEYLKDRAVWLPKWWMDQLGHEPIFLRGCKDE